MAQTNTAYSSLYRKQQVNSVSGNKADESIQENNQLGIRGWILGATWGEGRRRGFQ